MNEERQRHAKLVISRFYAIFWCKQLTERAHQEVN